MGSGLSIDGYGVLSSTVNAGASNIGELTDGSYGAGTSNLFLGTNSGSNNSTSGTDGRNNTSVGQSTFQSLTSGSNNTTLGMGALKDIVDGNNNTAVGYASLFDHVGDNANTALGSYSMTYGDNDNISNTAVGYTAMRGKGSTNKFNNTKYNTAVGSGAMYNILGGDNNSALGVDASRNLETGIGNSSIGYRSLYQNTDGNYNVAIGFQAGYGYNDPGMGGLGITTGNGDKNVFIGYQAGYKETGSNKLYIENSNSTTPLIWGDFSNNLLNFNGKVGIGTADPKVSLDIPDMGGLILAFAKYTGSSITLSTSYQSIGDITFTAPKSGNIIVEIQGWIAISSLSSSSGFVRFKADVDDVSITDVEKYVQDLSTGGNQFLVSPYFLISNLTPGTSYTIDLKVKKSSSSGTSYFFYDQGYSDGAYAKVISAPTTIQN